MKKILIIGTLVLVLLGAAAVTAGVVYAQTVTPPAQQGQPDGTTTYGGMMNGGRGGMMNGGRGGMMNGSTDTIHMWDADSTDTIHMRGEGFMHDDMVAAIAPELGLTAEELQVKLDAGETMWQLAENKGISEADFTVMMTKAHTAVLDQAVADGEITQAQADLMKQNYEAKLASGWLPGRCECQQGGGMKGGGMHGRGGMRGGRQGNNQGTTTTTEPTVQP